MVFLKHYKWVRNFTMQSPIASAEDRSIDSIESNLQKLSQNILVFVFGLLPIFFIPTSYVLLDYAKITFVIVGVLLAIIFFSLSVLRSGKLHMTAPLALAGLWLVAMVTAVAAVLSGDMKDAFFGDDLNVHTSIFVLLIALIATLMPIVGHTKTTIMRTYILLTGSAILLCFFHLIRMVFGVDVLTFGVFTDLVDTPLGRWNDLAIFFGLSVLLALVALEQLPLTRWGKVFFSSVITLSLFILAVVNFFAVWMVLGLVSLVMLMYSLTKDRFAEKTLTLEGKKNSLSMQSVILSMLVFVVSVIFIIGGGGVGSYISQFTGISYIEVRPSFEATTGIVRNVYKEDPLFGIGPNKFVDAWRLYKDPAINQTVFWATDFNGASGYVTTLFVTTGVLGFLSLILFFGLFLFTGFRMLFKSFHVDRFWYFIGSSAFVAALYLWGISFVYVPSAVILLLAAFFTGVTFTSYGALVPARHLSFSLASNKRAGFVLIGVVMLVIVAATYGLYNVGKHYTNLQLYIKAVYSIESGGDLKTGEEQIAIAYNQSGNEAFALQLALYQIAKMNALSAVAELSTEQQQELQFSASNGLDAARKAAASDPSDARHWSVLGSVLSFLAGAGVEGTKEQAQAAFTQARSLEPANPLYLLLEAQLNSRTGDFEASRSRILEAIQMKPNYTDALYFLTQLDIAEGKIDDAITTSRTIAQLESANPARQYQLGYLLLVDGQLADAIEAFNRAIARDQNYANARYFLARAYAENNEIDKAIEQLEVVLMLNPNNAEVIGLIERLRSGRGFDTDVAVSTPALGGPEVVTEVNNTVITTEDPDTPLVSPVNTVNNAEEEESEAL